MDSNYLCNYCSVEYANDRYQNGY